ncbi:MAG: hypothetical protein ACREMY_29550, partial [bacterium]
YRDSLTAQKFPLPEPRGTPAPVTPGERQLRMTIEIQMEAGGGIAETLANVFTPAPCPAPEVRVRQILFADLGRPAEFTASARLQFLLQHGFPRSAHGISQPDPCKMEQFMTKDAGKLVRIVEQSRVENHAAIAQIGGGVDRLAFRLARQEACAQSGKGRAKSNLDGAALKQFRYGGRGAR